MYLYLYLHLIEGGVCGADDDLNGGDEEVNQPTAEPRELGFSRVNVHLCHDHDGDGDDDDESDDDDDDDGDDVYDVHYQDWDHESNHWRVDVHLHRDHDDDDHRDQCVGRFLAALLLALDFTLVSK